MRFYELKLGNGSPVDGTYVGTFAEARQWARKIKQEQPAWDLPNFVVHEVDIQTDKEGVLAALAWRPIKSEPLRRWKITPRGGLREVTA